MKKITIITLTIISLLISGCGSKVPYKSQEPLENASLVYIYVTATNNFTDTLATSIYQVRINGKKVKQKIAHNEYMALDLKTNEITISATRTQIEERSLKLKLENGKIYYLRVKTDMDDGGFEFEEVKGSVGMQEIVKTGLAGSTLEDKDTKLTELVGSKNSDEVKKEKFSKIDEIKKAHNLKEQGVISNEEFEALKKEILDK